MANLKEIRTRISSVKSTRQITSAMKMVSAAKLRRAQDAILQMRPYSEKLQVIIKNLSDSIEGDISNPYTEVREMNHILLIPITSNKGLCGAFNANIIKSLRSSLEDSYSTLYKSEKADIFPIGKKGADLLKSKSVRIITPNIDLMEDLNYENALDIINDIMNQFISKKYDRVILIYNKFKNAAIQEIKTEELLPVRFECGELSVDCEEDSSYYIYEPSQKYLLEKLIPQYIRGQFYKALRESFASEHGARMTSMHKATDNATDLIKELTLNYNKARQATITNEILEIVGGAEALNG